MGITRVRLEQLTGIPSIRPHLREVIATSNLPNNTAFFTLKGSYFTPDMGIDFRGQTVNSIDFISDNEVNVSVSTGATEGLFDIILNNGIEVTFKEVLLIALGEVFIPTEETITIVSGQIDTSIDGQIKVLNDNIAGIGEFFSIPIDKDFRLEWKFSESLVNTQGGVGLGSSRIDLLTQAGNKVLFRGDVYLNKLPSEIGMFLNQSTSGFGFGSNVYNSLRPPVTNHNYMFERINGILHFKINGVTKHTFTDVADSDVMKIQMSTRFLDIINIRYIELV